MQSSRFFWTLYLGYVVLILLTASILGFLIGRGIERQVLESTRSSLYDGARTLREATEPLLLSADARELAGLQRRVEQLASDTGIRYTVFTSDGTVVADSEGETDASASRNDPEVRDAFGGLVGSDVRPGGSLGADFMYVAVPSTDSGVVRAAMSLGAIADRQNELRTQAIVASAIGALIALGLGFFVAQRITAPLVSLNRTAREISAGNFRERLEIRRHDAFGTFAQSFNLMASQLQERIETITDDRNNLWTILSSMVEGVVAVDENGRVILMNDVAAEILGADPRLARGSSFEAVTRVGEVRDAIADTMGTGERGVREVLLPAFPRDRIIEVYGSPIREPSGGVVVVLHDVTELRRLEGVRRDFVANVSHELKTPLTVIRGIVETMLDDTEMDPSTRFRFLEKAEAQTQRISLIVSDLLRLARLEAEESNFHYEILDLRELITGSVRALQGSADGRSIALGLDVPPEPVYVAGDREALRLVADNLLDNAVKYSRPQGRVDVRVRRDGGRALLEVEDTGVGIAPAERERIFERFYRVDKARSRELGGTGLGLSIVRNAVHAHQGVVTCESELGRGSTFRVWLPLDDGEPALENHSTD